jgi:hypothetical protein
MGVKQLGERINAPTFGERYKKALDIQGGGLHPSRETR